MYVSPLFFFKNPAATEIYSLSLHDALPIFERLGVEGALHPLQGRHPQEPRRDAPHAQEDCDLRVHRADRKSTRLNSSHANISYAVFCLKKKQRRYLYHRASLLPEFLNLPLD